MRFSEETIDLILDIKEFSGGKLKNEFELSALIEYTKTRPNSITFDSIIFKAKFLKGLSKVIAVNSDSKEDMEKLLSEYTEELKNLTILIQDSLIDSDAVIMSSLKNKFFELTPDCFLNLNLLIEDLSVCKDYFNDLKNKH